MKLKKNKTLYVLLICKKSRTLNIEGPKRAWEESSRQVFHLRRNTGVSVEDEWC